LIEWPFEAPALAAPVLLQWAAGAARSPAWPAEQGPPRPALPQPSAVTVPEREPGWQPLAWSALRPRAAVAAELASASPSEDQLAAQPPLWPRLGSMRQMEMMASMQPVEWPAIRHWRRYCLAQAVVM
jgi:hypothetical protein